MIRELRLTDAERMLACLLDESVTFHMPIRNSHPTIEKCRAFVEQSHEDKLNKHFAIVDESDRWIGTVSLKNIENKEAEYAIITCAEAHGKGYAKQATIDILRYGFEQLGLNKIYLYVAVSNVRANKFYQKFGFRFDRCDPKSMVINGNEEDINWYYLLKADLDKYVQKI